ncbi:MAG: DUF5664 domain-containing protein [Paracoccus sp. (in: a-proteobacteria)]|nr:DUF5664 domain-containing protein [Paracoccus sp. (in: a-proteobacteria)]
MAEERRRAARHQARAARRTVDPIAQAPRAIRAMALGDDPKGPAGAAKVPFDALPMQVIAELAVAHGEGALKYGRHNWRFGKVRASTYYAAALRHLTAWIDGEDTDPDSGLSHIVKAMASLSVMRDAMLTNALDDDRPLPPPEGMMARANKAWADLRARHPGKGVQ